MYTSQIQSITKLTPFTSPPSLCDGVKPKQYNQRQEECAATNGLNQRCVRPPYTTYNSTIHNEDNFACEALQRRHQKACFPLLGFVSTDLLVIYGTARGHVAHDYLRIYPI